MYLGAIGVSWSAPADASGVTGYVVEYRTAAACSDTAHADRTACEAASETWTAAGQWMDAAWDAEDGLAAFIGASDVDDDLVEGTALEVDTAYDVRVAAVGVLGVGAWADDTATPITETRAPGTPRNILVRPAPGGLVVTWDRPLDPGNPPFEDYVVEVKPTDGWDCNNPATGQPWTGAEEDFPLWVAVHCVNHYERVVNGETLPAGFYPPESGWAQTHINLSGSQSIGPYDGPNTYSMRFLTDGVEYQVRMRAEGVNVEDPDNAGEYIALASDWSPVMTGTPGPRPPGVPQNLSVTPGDQSMAATWAAPEDPGDPALEGYVFQWRQAGATPPAAWESAVTLTAAYDVAMLTNGTEYEARVAGFHHHAMWTAPAGVHGDLRPRRARHGHCLPRRHRRNRADRRLLRGDRIREHRRLHRSGRRPRPGPSGRRASPRTCNSCRATRASWRCGRRPRTRATRRWTATWCSGAR